MLLVGEKEKRLKALEPQAFFAIMVGVAGFDEAVVQTPSSRSLATVHWTVAWEWVRIFESIFIREKAGTAYNSCLWSEWRDSNPRPLGPEPSAIPSFATPR